MIGIIEGVLITLVSEVLKNKLDKFFSLNIGEQFLDSIEDAFHNLSEKYPNKIPNPNYTFWDQIIVKYKELSVEESTNDLIGKKVIKETIRDIINNQKRIENINLICDEFWNLFRIEVSSHQELSNYMLLKNQEETVESFYTLINRIDSNHKTDNKLQQLSEEIFRKELTAFYSKIVEYKNNAASTVFHSREFEMVDTADNNKIKYNSEELLNKNKSFYIKGEAGFGKSFLLKQILMPALINISNKNMPVYLKLSLFGVKYNSIQEGIQQYFSQYISSINSGYVTELLKNGNLVLFLDGLDEVKVENYQWCLEEILSIRKTFSENKCIITGREEVHHYEVNSFLENIELKPLSEKQIKLSIRNLGYNEHELNMNIKLLENPLLLNITLELLKENTFIMKRKIDFYNQYVDYMIGKWEKKKGKKLEKKVSENQLKKIFSALAYKFFDNVIIEEDELERVINDLLPNKSESIVKKALYNTNLLNVDEYYGVTFLHETFKEYFAGMYLRDNKFSVGKCNISEITLINDKWKPAIIFLSGLIRKKNDKEVFFDRVLAIDLKLFLDCVKNESIYLFDYKTMTDKEQAISYLNVFLDTYKIMVNKYFNDLKYEFAPFKFYYSDYDKDISIVWEHLSRKSIYYTITKSDKSKLLEIDDSVEGFNQLGKIQMENNVKVYTLSTIGYNWKHKFYKTPRQMAVKLIWKELESILKENRLIYDKILLSNNYLSKIRKLNIEPYETIEDQVSKINNYINRLGIKRNSSDLKNAKLLLEEVKLIKQLEINPWLYDLPQPDKTPDINSKWIWSNYSENQMINRVKRFFELYLKSYRTIVEKNFSVVKNNLSGYSNLPVDIHVEMTFPKDNNGNNLEPSLMYYCLASKNFSTQTVNVRVVEKIETFSHDVFYNIEKSFEEYDRKASEILISNSGFTMVLKPYRQRNRTVLESFIYRKIKSNLDKLFNS